MPRRDQNRAKSGWLLSKSASKRSVGDAAHTLHTGVADGALWFWCAVTRDGAHSNIQRCRLLLKIRL